MSATPVLPATFAPVRLARLSRGLLMTLRTLSSNSGDEWTGMSLSKKLAIQRFYKDFEVWIRELEAMSVPNAEAVGMEERLEDPDRAF